MMAYLVTKDVILVRLYMNKKYFISNMDEIKYILEDGMVCYHSNYCSN